MRGKSQEPDMRFSLFSQPAKPNELHLQLHLATFALHVGPSTSHRVGLMAPEQWYSGHWLEATRGSLGSAANNVGITYGAYILLVLSANKLPKS